MKVLGGGVDKNSLNFVCGTKAAQLGTGGDGILSPGPRARDSHVEAETLRVTFRIHYQFLPFMFGASGF